MPNVAVINESVSVSDAEVQAMTPALAEQWNTDVRNAWEVEAATFASISNTERPMARAWWVVFLDDSEQAEALTYHDLTDEGLPIAKVFVGGLFADNASISVGASREICAMAIDPWLNATYQDAGGMFWAKEVCDPVEDQRYGYQIGGVPVADFVTPGWFARPHAGGLLDAKGHVRAPFQILGGGHAHYFEARRGWVSVTGARVTGAGVTGTGTTVSGSRFDRRVRQAGEPLKCSGRRWPRPT